MRLVKNKESTDYSEIVKDTYRLVRSSFGYTARIINIWDILRLTLGIEEFEILMPEMYNNASFESYLVNKQIDWMRGEDIDFNEIYEAILVVGDFTSEEKRLMINRKLEEILWGIFLAICNPELNF